MDGSKGLTKWQMEELEQMAKLQSYCTVKIGDDEAALMGMLRIAEQGVSVLRVSLSGQFPLYGEWNTQFEENGYDYNIVVISFGYASIYNIGNNSTASKEQFGDEYQVVIKNLLKGLFKKAVSEKAVFPLTSKNAVFTGFINYKEGWI